MRASGYDRVADDWYVEPAWLVEALLKVEQFKGSCWDPACGGGTIPKTLRAAGLHCAASDIVHRGCPDSREIDFFRSEYHCDNIISNPPYGVLPTFIDRALYKTSAKVCVVARLAFLEGLARRTWFQSVPLARVWVASRRPSMPPGGSDQPAKGGSIAYAWFVFEHGHAGPWAGGWLS